MIIRSIFNYYLPDHFPGAEGVVTRDPMQVTFFLYHEMEKSVQVTYSIVGTSTTDGPKSFPSNPQGLILPVLLSVTYPSIWPTVFNCV